MRRKHTGFRRRVGSIALLLVALLGAGSCTGTSDTGTSDTRGSDPGTSVDGAAPTAPPSSEPLPSRGALLADIDELVVTDPDPDRPSYERDDWDEGLDADDDCLRTRHEVLLAESVVPATVDGCHVVGGEWRDPLTGAVVTDPGGLQVDHLVALADAHRSGGWRWDADRKADYANELDDPYHLNAVLGGENQRKADDGPEAYRPANPAAWCWYGAAYTEVKLAWDLTVTAAQHDGLVDLARSCPDA